MVAGVSQLNDVRGGRPICHLTAHIGRWGSGEFCPIVNAPRSLHAKPTLRVAIDHRDHRAVDGHRTRHRFGRSVHAGPVHPVIGRAGDIGRQIFRGAGARRVQCRVEREAAIGGGHQIGVFGQGHRAVVNLVATGGDAVGQHRGARHRQARSASAVHHRSRAGHGQRTQGERVALNVQRAATGQTQFTRAPIQGSPGAHAQRAAGDRGQAVVGLRGPQHQGTGAGFGQSKRRRAIGHHPGVGQGLAAGHRDGAVRAQGDAAVAAQREGFGGRQAAAIQQQLAGGHGARCSAQVAIARNLQPTARHGGVARIGVGARQRQRASALLGQATGATDRPGQRHIVGPVHHHAAVVHDGARHRAARAPRA